MCRTSDGLPEGVCQVARFASVLGMLSILSGSVGGHANAQSTTFAGNAQHTALYGTPAQHLDMLRWSTMIDLQNQGATAHYGAPLITPANTVLVPVKTANGFQVEAFEGSTGRLKYTLSTDYILPSYDWVPAYQPALATSTAGTTRLYYAGAGGTIYYIENPDSETPSPSVQQCFYTSLGTYHTNRTNFNSNVFINTPFTADTNGVIFFGFRIQASAPAPLNTTNSGFARVDWGGLSSYVLANQAAGDNQMARDSHNCAPALSNDGSVVYVAVKGAVSAYYGYLLGLDNSTLATRYKVLLRDPRNGNYAGIMDDSTASPVVGPDGDVFFGVYSNPNNGRGFLLHFSPDLKTQKPPGGFGWDFTPGIVPTNMLPSYTGRSSYLLFSKYNSYAGTDDGNGVNRIALLDPNATQIDPHPTAAGLLEMREILTVIGCTPDSAHLSPILPFAVREWCINTAAVNPPTGSMFVPSEDGRLYRWNFARHSLTETFILGLGLGAPYVPTVIGPDGTIYALNGGTLFALGSFTNVAVRVFSSAPDLSSVVKGQPVTFTAVVTNIISSGPVPTGTITFQDRAYQGLTVRTNILATNVPLTNSSASVTTSLLNAGSNFLGPHFITANYSGDTNFPSCGASLVQKVHAYGTTTRLSWAPSSGTSVVLMASVAVTPVAPAKPTGMVAFWDGSNFLAQVPLNTNGNASFTTPPLSAGSHAFNASYSSDTLCASSRGTLTASPPLLSGLTVLSNHTFEVVFSNAIGAPFTVLGSTNASLPWSNWTALGPAIEILPGQFQFSDPQATNQTQRFYRVRSP
jgi:hypothetical protein